MSKPSNTGYLVKIVILTVTGILGGSGVLIGTMFLFIDGPNQLELSNALIILFSGLLVAYVSIKFGISTYRNWTNSRIDAIVKDKVGLITHWYCPKAEWLVFADEKLKKNLESASGMGWIFGLVLGGIGAFVGYTDGGWMWSAIWGVIGLGSGFIASFIGKLIVKLRYQKEVKLDGVNIYFAEKSIVVHNKLLMFNQMMQSLVGFKIDEEMNPPAFKLIIETRGKNRAEHDHYIPIINGKTEEAKKLESYYQGLVVDRYFGSTSGDAGGDN
ncbi:MAG: hypothetical protein RJQ09_08080 [Cyclobacteriaceae bacterium]